MGDFFVMSMRFNKNTAADFGLIPTGDSTAVDPHDNSVWIKTRLYDFGWGNENGFYKSPLPDMGKLFEIVLSSRDEEDVYGAAVILEKHPEELLKRCEELLKRCEELLGDRRRKKDFKRMGKLFRLSDPVNRCPVVGKSYDEIKNDSVRWQLIAEKAGKV